MSYLTKLSDIDNYTDISQSWEINFSVTSFNEKEMLKWRLFMNIDNFTDVGQLSLMNISISSFNEKKMLLRVV